MFLLKWELYEFEPLNTSYHDQRNNYMTYPTLPFYYIANSLNKQADRLLPENNFCVHIALPANSLSN